MSKWAREFSSVMCKAVSMKRATASYVGRLPLREEMHSHSSKSIIEMPPLGQIKTTHWSWETPWLLVDITFHFLIYTHNQYDSWVSLIHQQASWKSSYQRIYANYMATLEFYCLSEVRGRRETARLWLGWRGLKGWRLMISGYIPMWHEVLRVDGWIVWMGALKQNLSIIQR